MKRNKYKVCMLIFAFMMTFSCIEGIAATNDYVVKESNIKTNYNNYPVLRRGATGSWVEYLQSLLGVEVDGIFGAVTEASVTMFQYQNDLDPDGIVGPKTWEALENYNY